MTQDAKDLEEGSSISLHSEVTPSIFISTGLDLENAQRHLRVDNAGLTQHSTNNQQTKILMRRNALQCRIDSWIDIQVLNALQCRIDSWIDIQVLYVPSVAHFHATGLSPSDEGTIDETTGCPKAKLNSIKAEDIPLFLPSSICNLTMLTTLSKNAALTFVSATSFYASRHNKFADKILTLVPKKPFKRLRISSFLVTRSILVLDHVGWERKLQPLRKSDLRPMGDLGGRTQGTVIMSWIWHVLGFATH
ncbi:hypothetical protein DFJ58DRAFT_841933 [Suillus subalutaceus]|uniref:uncharacterized protein n=1 Tax=Suillus subalutaceus TaxID=48586 RepID=UPI001B86ED96|nr:uncharacterized protein DFJ58DRAFT_841933 [Suillus subalutaceus]KAG1852280.1 hypothetical protein DFJ58DRAFT_841933 [Suillus subalutaceus]